MDVPPVQRYGKRIYYAIERLQLSAAGDFTVRRGRFGNTSILCGLWQDVSPLIGHARSDCDDYAQKSAMAGFAEVLNLYNLLPRAPYLHVDAAVENADLAFYKRI